jgi:putative peptidoglycan lipid II flippase
MSRALNNTQILRAAAVVLFGFLASGVLGLVRTGAFSATFGASAELDAFYAAQRIPELLFTLVAGGALGSSFIPVFTRYLNDESRDHAWRLASAVMTLSVVAAGGIALLVAIFAPVIVPAILVPGAPPAQQALTIALTRLMLVTTVIFAISGLAMGILNAHQNFLFPAMALSFNNLGYIFGALVLTQTLPAYTLNDDLILGLEPILPAYATLNPEANIFGLAIGAILGAGLHLLIQIPGLIRLRARLRVLFVVHLEGVREIFTLMLPRVFGLAVVQINFIVNVAFASAMVEGSQTALTTGWFITYFTLGIIAQSMGTAVFPTLSALAADGDMASFRLRLATAMRTVLFLSFPAMVGLIALGVPIMSIFERAEWTPQHTEAAAWALAFFAVGLAGHSLLEVLSRAFYALGDTWTPVKIGVVAMVTNIIFSVILIQFIGNPAELDRGPFAGLALANSIATMLESMILWWLLRRRIGGLNDRGILIGAGQAMAAALGMGVVVLGLRASLQDIPTMVLLGAGIGIGGITFFGLAVLLRMDEVGFILRRFRPSR